MEGRLRKEKLSVRIDTECACCGRKLSVQLDEQLRGEVIEGNPEPLVFSPDVDWDTFDEPNITHAY